jgi:hypothetical protein
VAFWTSPENPARAIQAGSVSAGTTAIDTPGYRVEIANWRR